MSAVSGVAPRAAAAADSMPRAARHDDGIDALRGTAALLVLAFHSQGQLPALSGTLVDHFQQSFLLVRMPLFAALAGFVYALRPVGRRQLGAFLRGKSRRLLVPLVCVSSLSLVLRFSLPFVELPRSFADFWHPFVWPLGQYWFLAALFLVLVLVALLDLFRWLATPTTWLLATAAAALLQLAAPPGEFDVIDRPFAADGFVFLLPFFLLGLGLQRFTAQVARPAVLAGVGVLGGAGALLQQLAWYGLVEHPRARGGIASLVVGGAAALLLIHWRPPLPPLAWLGRLSYTIYLFYGYGIGVAREALGAAGVTWSDGSRFAATFACALALPILAHHLLRPFALPRRLLLGLH